jgi:carbonic anhydrase
MSSIVDRIRPSIEGLVHTELARDRERLRREAMRANVRASVDHLRHGSAVIEGLALREGLVVIGAELDLTSGEVGFFGDVTE